MEFDPRGIKAAVASFSAAAVVVVGQLQVVLVVQGLSVGHSAVQNGNTDGMVLRML
jgi:hypothetical protein